MVASTYLCLAVGLCSSSSDAPVPGDPGLLSFPIEYDRRHLSLSRRADGNGESVVYNISTDSYLVELSIGTPGQKVKVAIDTGSDEFWVNPNCDDETLIDSEKAECRADGLFNATASSSVASVGTSYVQLYGLGETRIDYVQDDVSLPGSSISVKKVQFGIAKNTTQLNEGVLGLGFGKGKNLNYSNFIDVLQEQGATKSPAFSLALGSVDEDNGGVLIFGGIDTKKFAGDLKRLDVLGPDDDDKSHRYYVELRGLGRTDASGASKTYGNDSIKVLIDSGSALSALPAGVLDELAKDMAATYTPDGDQFIIHCDEMKSNATVDFAFKDLTIRVPYKQFILRNSETECIIGAQRSSKEDGPPYYVLGDSFMRSAYVVFDQQGPALWMAPYANCGRNETQIPSGGVAAGGTFAGQCGAGDSRHPGPAGSNGTSSSSSSSSSSSPSSKNGQQGSVSSAASHYGSSSALLSGAIIVAAVMLAPQ